MAELLLKGVDSGGWRRGDVVCAFNDRRIGLVHAEHICDYRLAGFTSEGLRPHGLAAEFQALCYAYRFVRVRDKVLRYAKDGTVEEFGPEPNHKREFIHVDVYLRNRLRHHAHRIYGAPGREYWYGGRFDNSAAGVAAAWDLIEGSTPYRRALHPRWPLGRREVPPNFYSVVTEDFDEAQARALVAEGEAGRRRATNLAHLIPGMLRRAA